MTVIKRLLCSIAAGLSLASTASVRGQAPRADGRPFRLEVLVDFADDVLVAGRALTPADLDALMAELAGWGIRRVSWAYYGDGHGGQLTPAGYADPHPLEGDPSDWQYFGATYRRLGNPLQVAVAAGHRHGLEVYAYYKPYETGPAISFPSGSPEAKQWGLLPCIGGRLAWMDPFVLKHPELRIKRRTDDIPAWAADATIATIRLVKRDAAPTRITRDHLQIWTSPDNYRYRRVTPKFAWSESIERSRQEVRDNRGNLLIQRGDPVRVLTLSGLPLRDRFVLVTTDFAGGQPDFVNSGLAIVTMFDPQGREIPGTVATGGTIWGQRLMDFRRAGLTFDYGWDAEPVTLDGPNASGHRGMIAFARGRNDYLPAALCESEPAVQEFWLRCLDEMIAAGVDGVDFRDEDHSTHTDHPQDYGFNEVVLRKARALPGDLLQNIAEVRGQAYTEFLRLCRARLNRAGKRMRYNLNLDYYRPHPPANRLLAFPANLRFDWQRWVDDGLLDEAILRFFSLPFDSIFTDPIAQAMLGRCAGRGLPLVVNRYIGDSYYFRHTPTLPSELLRVKSDGRFAGFIFYELGDFIQFGAYPGQIRVINPAVQAAIARLR